jgi:hypothetical protein
MLTEEQIMVTMRFIVNKMRDEGVAINNPEQVLRWMILNPLPDHKTVATEAAEQETKEKAKRIALLTEELKRLEGN